jgi:antitoxin (DNA-binding transcriptional repressor) of toxin-antitoxin stability system
MKTMEFPAGQKQLRAAVRHGEAETVVLTRHGKPVAAVIPMKGVDAETLRLSTSPKFLNLLRRSFRQLDAGQTLSLAEMKRRMG